MEPLAGLKAYGRFALGLRGFLRHTVSLEEARVTVQRRLEDREANFLRLIERGIFGYPRSPYLPLLRLAGCEMGDIRRLVRSSGLEQTLHALRRAGVYVTFEEFKGRRPIIRGGQVVPVQAHDFDNPHLSHYYEAQSGGTTGAGTRVMIDLDHLAAQAPNLLLTQHAHGLVDVPTTHWFPILPAASGFMTILYTARCGQLPQRWFSPISSRDVKPSLRYQLVTKGIVAAGRLFHVPIPWPEPLPLRQASVLAHWAARMLEEHGVCLIRSYVSMAVRVCVAAWEEKLDLTGAVFWGSGEPPTPAKVRAMNQVGARWIPTYWFTEAGAIGASCVNPIDGNDIHFFKDCLALIQEPRRLPGTETLVDAFYFTSLLPTAPKLMLNVESDDYGVVEKRACGCALDRLGFTEHLRHIRSFSKLTGEGVTLVGSEMVRILEEVLPQRFGGSPLDYQLLEEEDGQGFTRLNLLISPRVGVVDEAAVVEAILEALGRSSVAADLAGTIWRQAGTLKIKRARPIWTAQGKLMPLRVIRWVE